MMKKMQKWSRRDLVDFRMNFNLLAIFFQYVMLLRTCVHVVTGSCKWKIFALIFPLAGKPSLASLFSLCSKVFPLWHVVFICCSQESVSLHIICLSCSSSVMLLCLGEGTFFNVSLRLMVIAHFPFQQQTCLFYWMSECLFHFCFALGTSLL